MAEAQLWSVQLVQPAEGLLIPIISPSLPQCPPICYHLQIDSVQLNSLLAVAHANKKINNCGHLVFVCLVVFFFMDACLML